MKIPTWHFVNSSRMLRDCSQTVAPGYIYSEPTGKLVLCERGMHASRHPFDALTYAPGPWLCRCLSWGDVIEGSDKLVSRHRQVLAMADVSSMLRLFACWCVRESRLADGRKVWNLDAHSRRAVETAERFARGEATEAELTAAWAPAWASAWDIAMGALWSAACRGAQRAKFLEMCEEALPL